MNKDITVENRRSHQCALFVRLFRLPNTLRALQSANSKHFPAALAPEVNDRKQPKYTHEIASQHSHSPFDLKRHSVADSVPLVWADFSASLPNVENRFSVINTRDPHSPSFAPMAFKSSLVSHHPIIQSCP